MVVVPDNMTDVALVVLSFTVALVISVDAGVSVAEMMIVVGLTTTVAPAAGVAAEKTAVLRARAGDTAPNRMAPAVIAIKVMIVITDLKPEHSVDSPLVPHICPNTMPPQTAPAETVCVATVVRRRERRTEGV